MASEPPTHPDRQLHDERLDLLHRVNRLTDRPLTFLAFVWLGITVLELTVGLSPAFELAATTIWVLFVLDFVIEFLIAPRKDDYLREHWFIALSLVLPALRGLRLFGALRLTRLARFGRTFSLLKLISSVNRSLGAIAETLGRRGITYVIVITVVITFAGAAGMARFESPEAVAAVGQTEAGGLANYGEALWWTAMIMTTLGSQYWPVTLEGRLLGWLLSLYALSIFGYITASIASHFIASDKGSGAGENEKLREEIADLRLGVARLTRLLERRDGG